MNNGASILELLDNLAEKREQRELIEDGRRRAIETVLSPDIVVKLEQINRHFERKCTELDAEIAELEAAVKPMVLQHGESVKGSRLHAVLQVGRVSWNTKGLDKLIQDANHTWLTQYRTVGEPSVSIRQVK